MIINNEMIPPVQIGESFIYLGKSFSFDMSTEHEKNESITDFNKYISILNQLPLHPKNKLQVISKFIYSKIRWRFSIYRLSETWVIQNVDSIIKEYVKRWLQLPQSTNFRHVHLPTKQLGMKFSLPSDVYLASQSITRKFLKALML